MAVILLLVVALAAVLEVRYVVAPRLDPLPPHVDAIVQLGGVGLADYRRSRELAAQGRTGDLVVSTFQFDASSHAEICAPIPGVRVHCFDPDPPTTRGEARAAGALAREYGWRSMAVYTTGPPHVGRARFVVERCTDAELVVDSHRELSGPREAAQQWVYQSGAWLKALAQDGC